MNKNLTFFLLLLQTTFCRTQTHIYYSSINLAEHYFLAEQHFQADSCFQVAFNLDSVKSFNQDYLIAAANSLYLKDTLLIKSYLYAFAKRGGDYKMLKNTFKSNIFLSANSKEILDYINLKSNKDLKLKLKLYFEEYKKTLNKKLISQIQQMYRSDQRVRSLNFLPWKTQIKIMNKADRRNLEKLISICQQYGWPGFNLLGEFRSEGKYTYSGIDLIIRHFEKEELKVIEPYYLDAIKKVNAYPYVWASCMDYCAIKNPFYMDSTTIEFKQLYGTMSKNGVLIPFGKMDSLNKSRSELFLGNIEDYLKIRGWSLPKDETVVVIRKKG
jgi:hypothetical protein